MIPPETQAKIEADLDHFKEVAKDWRPCCSRFYRADGDHLEVDVDEVDLYFEPQEDPEEFRVPNPEEGQPRRRRS